MTELQDGGLDAFCEGVKAHKTSSVVVGCFALLHAGTVSFLSQIKSWHKTVSVVILPDEGNLDADLADAAALLRRDERRRILGAMENIQGDVLVLGDTSHLKQVLEACGTNVKWFCNAVEGDVGQAALEIMSDAGMTLECVTPENRLSTRELLDRMRH